MLFDKGDRKGNSNQVEKGIVFLKANVSSKLSRIQTENFIKEFTKSIFATEGHVMPVIANVIFDGFTKLDEFNEYTPIIAQIIKQKDFLNKKNFKPNEWNKIKLQKKEVKVFAIETILNNFSSNQKLIVKNFIDNGPFGNQNNCAVITSAVLVLASAFKGNQKEIDQAIFSLIRKSKNIKEVTIEETIKEINGTEVKIQVSNQRLDTRSIRAFFATFLAVKGLFEENKIDITQDKELYKTVVEAIIENFQPLNKNIKDDVSDKNFWYVYQRERLNKIRITLVEKLQKDHPVEHPSYTNLQENKLGSNLQIVH